MNFSEVPAKSYLGRFLRLPLRCIPQSSVFPILQGPLRGKRWVVGSSDHGCWLGSYEYRKQRSIARSVSIGHTVYDIGANVGYYSLLFSKLVGADGRVFAFEPMPENFNCLKRHLALNHCGNVIAVQAALSDQTGTARFRQGSSNATGRLSSDGSLEVDVWTLDEWISRNSAPSPHCLKVDVEGAEYAVLTGALHTLRTAHPTIFLATHGRQVHDQCMALLNDLDYDLTSITQQDLEDTDEIVAKI